MARAAVLAGAAVCLGLAAPPATATPTPVGTLTYVSCLTAEEESGPGPVGGDACEELSESDFGGVNTGLDNPESVAVSPNGRSVYVVSRLDDAVMRFNRDRDTGELEFAFCFTGETESESPCETIPSATSGGEDSGLDQLEAVTVAPDGKAVYVTSRFDDAVAAFTREPDGLISYVGCVSGDSDTGTPGTGACTTVDSATPEGVDSGFDDLKTKELAISRDGEWLYAASDFDDSVLRFKRTPSTAKLHYRDCITGETESGPAPGGTGACRKVPGIASQGANSGLDAPRWVELSPNGRALYAASDGDHAVVRLERDPSSGKLTWGDCLSGEAASDDACRLIRADVLETQPLSLALPRALAVGGKQLYAAFSNDRAIATFSRKPGSGKLTYRRCLSGSKELGPLGRGVCSLTPTATDDGPGSGLDQVRDLEISSDGRSLYVAAQRDSAVATFKRKASNGKVSFARCITGDTDLGPSGSDACETIPEAVQLGDHSGLGGVETVALSDDGSSVYGGVEGDDAIATFTRVP